MRIFPLLPEDLGDTSVWIITWCCSRNLHSDILCVKMNLASNVTWIWMIVKTQKNRSQASYKLETVLHYAVLYTVRWGSFYFITKLWNIDTWSWSSADLLTPNINVSNIGNLKHKNKSSFFNLKYSRNTCKYAIQSVTNYSTAYCFI